MRANIVVFLAGALFSVGLAVSGMTQPSKVIGFLDFFGSWDPSLALVMAGAVAVHTALYRFIIKRPAPLLAPRFGIPTRKDIDWRLVAGGAIFGAGWGLAGYCPGPGITSLGALSLTSVVFVTAMFGGMALFKVWDQAMARRAKQAEAIGVPQPVSR